MTANTYNRQTHFANKLRKLRLSAQLTQVQLAKELNVSRSCLANYERGMRFPDADILSIIANYFKVNIDYLLSDRRSVCANKKHLITSNEIIKEVSSKGNLDISQISPISKIVLFEFYNFLCEQDEYIDEKSCDFQTS